MNKSNQIDSKRISNTNDTNCHSCNEIDLEQEIQRILNYIKQREKYDIEKHGKTI